MEGPTGCIVQPSPLPLLPSYSLPPFPYSALPFPVLPVFRINDSGTETPAVIRIIVVINHQIQSTIDRRGQGCLAANQEDLRQLPVGLKYVANQRTDTGRRHRIGRCSQDSRRALPSAIS